MRRQTNARRRSEGASAVARVSLGAINRIARRQHGLVTREQLLALGMAPRAIDRRVETGRLIRIHPGVYRVGPIRQPLEAEMAAVLAVGHPSAISHGTAVALHKLPLYPAKDGLVHVTVWDRQAAHKNRIVVHRTRHMPPDEVTRLNRIAVTTPARTILDVAPSLAAAALEQLIAAAHRQRPANTEILHSLTARYPRRPGTPAIRDVLAGKAQFTRSKPERRVLDALRRAGFAPEANAWLAGYEVDILLREQSVVVEVDGGPFHSARPDRRRDYARDAELQALGYVVIRVDADDAPERAIALVARVGR